MTGEVEGSVVSNILGQPRTASIRLQSSVGQSEGRDGDVRLGNAWYLLARQVAHDAQAGCEFGGEVLFHFEDTWGE